MPPCASISSRNGPFLRLERISLLSPHISLLLQPLSCLPVCGSNKLPDPPHLWLSPSAVHPPVQWFETATQHHKRRLFCHSKATPLAVSRQTAENGICPAEISPLPNGAKPLVFPDWLVSFLPYLEMISESVFSEYSLSGLKSLKMK